jgi:general secretion pathway protein G
MKRDRAPSRHEDGFTLMEMLVVLVIIGLIAAVAIPQVMKLLGNAKAKAAHIQIQTLSNSLNYFQLDVGRFPTDQEGLAALETAPANTPEWSGPYVRNDKQLIDPWGHPFAYKTGTDGKPYLLKSLGADGKEGGSGDDQDIVSDQ